MSNRELTLARRESTGGLGQGNLFDAFDEATLAAVAAELGALDPGGLAPAERDLLTEARIPSKKVLTESRIAIKQGQDPLGDAFMALRTPAVRRTSGAVYTPVPIIDAMLDGVSGFGKPCRIVDPGCGSARFLIRAAKRFGQAKLVGYEIDPLASLLAKANLKVLGLDTRAEIRLGDYRAAQLPEGGGPTLFLGNPPYVRHHLLSPSSKERFVKEAERLGFKASGLAGLHVHFYLTTRLLAQPGDFGSFVTAAEWLDVNYGSLVRELLLTDLGGRSITVIEPTAQPFPDTATTAAITSFVVGEKPDTIAVARVEHMADLKVEGHHPVKRERFEQSPRWSHLTRAARDIPVDFIELGELCRVHRGSVTGANRIWIAGGHSLDLPDSVQYASVTKARELFDAGLLLDDDAALKRVIDLPEDLDTLTASDRKIVDRFLQVAKAAGVDQGYIANARKAWWSVGLRKPAPVLATYMARRPPQFVRNQAQARHINVAHGLYPREAMTDETLGMLATYLSSSTSVHDGRTYAGGLTKFEPREMERLLVPRPEHLHHFI